MFRIILVVFLLVSFSVVWAEEFDESDYTDIFSDDEIFDIKSTKKSAAKAMLFSAIVPGAGQFYANPKSITAYIFPLIEAALWYTYIDNSHKGSSKESEYMEYADAHYVRDSQYFVQKDLIKMNLTDIYTPGLQEGSSDQVEAHGYWLDEYGNGGYFTLDEDNTQHFYEDVGKYDKYLFGWEDWYDIYAVNSEGVMMGSPNWDFQSGKWTGMGSPKNPDSEYYLQFEDDYDRYHGKYSHYRNEYIKKRREAENFYEKAVYSSFGLVFNHILGTLDALRVTKRRNWQLTSNNKIKFKIEPIFSENSVSLALIISKGF